MPHKLILRRARALIGTPFRLHGREPATGLDCVGMVAHVCGVSTAPTGYALRGGSAESWSALLDQFARKRQRGPARPGNILLIEAGPVQFHLGIWTGNSLIHADAHLRRTVETPGPILWPIRGCWFAPKGNTLWQR
jgi:murein DD-endopeptidase / murein LD-carboxypeptidase